MKNRLKKVFLGLLIIVTFLCACGFKPKKYALSHLYPALGVVDYYNFYKNEACFILNNGNNSKCSYPEELGMGDVICVIMHDNNTSNFTGDDYALKIVRAYDWEKLVGVIRENCLELPRWPGGYHPPEEE